MIVFIALCTTRQNALYAHRGRSRREIDSIFPFLAPARLFAFRDSTREWEPRDRRRPPRGRESAGAQSEWTVGPHHHSCPGYAPLLTALIVGQLIIAMFPVFRRYSTHLTSAVIRFWGDFLQFLLLNLFCIFTKNVIKYYHFNFLFIICNLILSK